MSLSISVNLIEVGLSTDSFFFFCQETGLGPFFLRVPVLLHCDGVGRHAGYLALFSPD
jgi:hypothetical protein